MYVRKYIIGNSQLHVPSVVLLITFVSVGTKGTKKAIILYIYSIQVQYEYETYRYVGTTVPVFR